jgi:hypothetical protein
MNRRRSSSRRERKRGKAIVSSRVDGRSLFAESRRLDGSGASRREQLLVRETDSVAASGWGFRLNGRLAAMGHERRLFRRSPAG